MTASRRRLNLPPALFGALTALLWNAVVVVILGIVWPMVARRMHSRWLYNNGLYDPLMPSWMLWRRTEGNLFGTAIPALAGGALLGRMLGRLIAEGRGSRGWASCLGAGVALAAAEIVALIVAISEELIGYVDPEWYVWLVDTMARVLLGIGGPAVIIGLIVGWRLWKRLDQGQE